MKLTKKIEAEVLKAYHAYWDAYFRGDMTTFASFLDDNECRIIGSTEFDVFNNKKDAVKYYTATAEQITGKAESRNPQITLLPYDKNIMVEELSDFYFFADEEWHFYGHARLSTLFSKKEDGWKIIYQHGSMPDTKAEEGQQLAAEEIVEENRQLRDAVKRRTVELEEKNRELEIEAALEKVRSRTMAMQKSDELAETSFVLFQQFKDLGETSDQISIGIFNEAENIMELYSTLYGSQWKEAARVDLNEPVVMKKIYAAWKEQIRPAYRTGRLPDGQGKSFVIDLSGNQLTKYNAYRKKLSNLDYNEKRWVIHIAFFSKGVLTFSTTEPHPNETIQLLERFAGVFDGTYTRFLDLQKAEAQAREAEMELALERLRAKTMSMHNSEDVSVATATMFNELKRLNIQNFRGGILIIRNDQTMDVWSANTLEDGKIMRAIGGFDMTMHPFWRQLYAGWKDKIDLAYFDMSDKVREDYVNILNARRDYLPEGIQLPDCHVQSYFFNEGAVWTFSLQPHTDDQKQIMKRFAAVFSLTFRRYQDLKKAEAQAREAQIQLALERVRARTMAMQHSDELGEASHLLVTQVQSLGIKVWGCAFNIFNEEEKNSTEWFSNEHGYQPTYKIPRKGIFLKYYEAAKKGGPLHIEEFRGEKCAAHYRYLSTLPVLGDVLKGYRESGLSIPDHQIDHVTYFKQGYLLFVTEEPALESHDIFKRFAKVFEQTYTRFLDLQKAEAQVREAKIEAALERVRSRSMGMQKSEELKEVIKIVYQQLTHLKINLDHSGFVVDYTPAGDWHFWIADKQDIPSKITHPYFESVWASQFNEAKEKGTDFFATNLNFEEKNKFYNELLSYVPGLPEASKHFYLSCPGLAATTVLFDNVSLYIENFSGIPYSEEENKILMRFGKVFQQTYTRFLDLQKAEAQSRESQIEAALERVRSRSMAMHKSEELLDVITVVSEQLHQLNFKFDHVSFAINNQEQDYNFWVSLVGQPQPYKLHVPYLNNPMFERIREVQKNKLAFYADTLTHEENRHWHLHVFENTDLKYLSGEIKEYILKSGYARSIAIMPNIMLILGNYAAIPYADEANEIFKRFAQVFEQSYTRFLDLQKAEAQAKEAQIEVALERVRTVALSLNKSDELLDIAEVLYEQLLALGFTKIRNSIIDIHNEKKETFLDYDYSPDMGKSVTLMSYYDHPIIEKQVQQMKSSSDAFFEIILEGQDLQDLIDLRIKNGEKEDARLHKIEQLTYNFYSFGDGGIGISNFGILNDEQKLLLKRFRNVFAFAYKRYRDLAQAEYQAREARIEAALEKVRSRSLAMHKSEELQEVVRTVFDRLNELDIIMNAASIFIFKEGSGDLEQWVALSGQQYSTCFHLSYFDFQVFRDLKEARESEKDSFIKKYSFQEKNDWFQFAFEHTDYRQIADDRKKYLLESESAVFSYALTTNTGLQLANYEGQLFSEKEMEILKRFAKVFEQAYIRFLDLQKAEEQAREAQIEAALERVRAKTMAMHESEQLAETAKVFFEQFDLLGKIPDRMSIGIINEESKKVELWVTDQSGNQVNNEYFFSLYEHTSIAKTYKAWKEGKETIIVDLTGENLREWLQYVKQDAKLPIDETKIKGRRVQQAAFFRQGFLLFTTHEPVADEIMRLLARFARVFEQTYTRFLDLQKAEAQAKEGQIENALEKVRSRSLAMHTSEELQQVVAVVFERLKELDISMDAANINIFTEGSRHADLWIASTAQDYVSCFHLPYIELAIPSEIFKARENGDDFFAKIFSHGEKNEYFNFLFEHSDFKYLPLERKNKMLAAPAYAVSFAFTKKAAISIHSYSGKAFSDQENDILKRFAKVFEQAYIRFLDLQKAETQAKEATRQASLDRVRGQIASMRSTEDLNRITPLIWHELTALGVPFIRCGVFIIDENNATSHVYLSSPDGRSLAVLNLPFNSNELTTNAVDSWRKGTAYHQHWNKEEFINWTKSLMAQGQIQNQETFQGAASPPEKLDLHFIPFTQGMLYVGSVTELSEQEIGLVKSLAEAFAIAYARYEDFVQLEKAKENVETALSNLQAAQKQLIQSEKMASLGELTAGIAHEIQNPLNFVNNFSEVNKELLAEMKEEMDKGNISDAKAIANDLIDNEEKINHHGRRADAIVKNMLQHSRINSGQKQSTDINALADEYLRLSYHGLRAKDKSFNATIKSEFDDNIGKLNIIPQDIGRVLLNLYNNAFYAVAEKKKQQPAGYQPAVSVSSKKTVDKVEISVKDNGNGIPQKVIDKIFQPFFTTKPTGQGTGLGLSLSYDIIKAHGGEIKVETKEDEGTTFKIHLPV